MTAFQSSERSATGGAKFRQATIKSATPSARTSARELQAAVQFSLVGPATAVLLQRMVGNQAVRRLLERDQPQDRPRVSPAHNPFEPFERGVESMPEAVIEDAASQGSCMVQREIACDGDVQSRPFTGSNMALLRPFAQQSDQRSIQCENGRRYVRAAHWVAAECLTDDFVAKHLADSVESHTLAIDRNFKEGLTRSHSIQTTELAKLMREMRQRQINRYQGVPRYINPATNRRQYRTQFEYNIWETLFDNRGRAKKTRLVRAQFYYDTKPEFGYACHHFDGIVRGLN